MSVLEHWVVGGGALGSCVGAGALGSCVGAGALEWDTRMEGNGMKWIVSV